MRVKSDKTVLTPPAPARLLFVKLKVEVGSDWDRNLINFSVMTEGNLLILTIVCQCFSYEEQIKNFPTFLHSVIRFINGIKNILQHSSKYSNHANLEKTCGLLYLVPLCVMGVSRKGK